MKQISNSDFKSLANHVERIINTINIKQSDLRTQNAIRITRNILKKISKT